MTRKLTLQKAKCIQNVYFRSRFLASTCCTSHVNCLHLALFAPNVFIIHKCYGRTNRIAIWLRPIETFCRCLLIQTRKIQMDVYTSDGQRINLLPTLRFAAELWICPSRKIGHRMLSNAKSGYAHLDMNKKLCHTKWIQSWWNGQCLSKLIKKLNSYAVLMEF